MFNIAKDKNSLTIKHSPYEEEIFRIIEIKYHENEKYFLLQGINSEYVVYKYDQKDKELREVTNRNTIKVLFGNIDVLFDVETWLEKKLLLIPILILFLYPLSELIIWIIAHVFPLIWSNHFSTADVTDFATKYLPYAYHPNIKWFSHFAMNVMCFFVASYGAIEYLNNDYSNTENRIKWAIIPTFIFALILIYAIFEPNLYNSLEPYALWGFIPFVFLIYQKFTGGM